jgi:hypothetical protein
MILDIVLIVACALAAITLLTWATGWELPGKLWPGDDENPENLP